jgi:hypothetical protein
MIELLLALCLTLPRHALADAGPAAAAPITASAAAEDQDVYFAPLDDAAGDSAEASSAPVGSRLSRARLRAFAWGHPGRSVDGAELYLDGSLVGRSPLALDGVLVSAAGVSLAARADGYEEALRPRLDLPADGSVAVALLPEDAADAITLPGWAVGLGLVVAGVLTYQSASPGAGLGIAGGGLLCAALTQLWARFVTLPRLRAAVGAYNARPEPEPAP